MTNTDQYFVELKNLKFTQTEIDNLLTMVDELSEYWINWEDNKEMDPIFNFGWWLKCPGLLNHPRVQEVVKKLPPDLAVTRCSVMKSAPWFHLTPHTDPRNGSFILPLTPNPSPIHFLDKDNNFLYEHTYTCPTVINAHVRHTTNNLSPHDRITFQLGIVQPWEDIVRILKESDLA